jgi:ABC-type nitrate/sulfonate/bicarbonate transport system substrate-binding protein
MPEKMMPIRTVATIAALTLACTTALADDTLKISVGARGAFDNQVSEVGQQQGFFKKRGLELEVLYTQGGGETLTTVIAGAVDVGISIGTLGALGAYAKGAPIRVIGGSMIGAYEFWYVPANSPIKSLKDAANKSVAYSTTGSSTNLMVLGFQELYGVKLKPVATGNPVATLTQVMSGQVDVGYSVPPFGVAELEQGKIRIVGRGNDIPALAKQTVRFIVVNADALAKRPDAFRRYMQGYRDMVDWMFSADPQAVAAYAKWAGVSESVARRTRDDFILKQNALPDQISGLDAIMTDAVTYKFLPAPLTAEQLKTLIQLQEPIR